MPAPESYEVAFAIRGPICRADLPGLCERVCAVLARSGGVVSCDVSGVGADAATVDALARLQLAAQRRECCVELRNVSRELLELVELMGLSHVFVTRD
jgi:ABC-type transporter Mla MlaB component